MIAIASDHGGYDLKEKVKKYLEEKNIPVQDFGCDSKASCDYPVFGHAAAKAVADGTCEKGIVICTTGIGISISESARIISFSADCRFPAVTSMRVGSFLEKPSVLCSYAADTVCVPVNAGGQRLYGAGGVPDG